MNILDKNIKRKYSVSDYSPDWVNQFISIKKIIMGVFGDCAIQIEHVGSTSVPGMKAKPLIDVLVVVDKMQDFSIEKNIMMERGYECGENYIAPNTIIFFKLGLDGDKLENIHICEKDNPKIKQFIFIRDFLRAFPEVAKEYSDLKDSNFKKYPNNYPAYREAKANFLERIEQEAYLWKKQINKPR